MNLPWALPWALSASVIAWAAPSFVPLLAPDFVHPVTAALAAFFLLVTGELLVYTAMARSTLREALQRVGVVFLPSLILLAGWQWVPFSGGEGAPLPERQAGTVWGLVWVIHLASYVFILIPDSLGRGRRTLVATFGLAALVLFSGATLQSVRCDLSGDEPHYLLMAQSLILDGDLELTNNYTRSDANSFYHRGVLQPQGNEHAFPDGKRYSHHPLGPVLLFLPGFLLGSRVGAALFVSILTAACLALTLAAVGTLGFKPKVVEKAGWVLLFASPLLLYSNLAFAEIPTALAVSGAMVLLAKRRWGFLGVVLGLLLWMHNRNVLLVLPALGAALFAWWKGGFRSESFRRLIGGFLVPTAALAAAFFNLYGAFTPLGAHNESFFSLFKLSRFAVNFPGLLLDQEAGLWFVFPIFTLIPAGLLLGWRRGTGSFRLAAGVLCFYYAAMSFYQNLGLQPAARFLSSLSPLLVWGMMPALEKLETSSRGWKRFAFGLFGFSTLMNLLLAAIPWLRFNPLNGENWVLKFLGRLTGIPFTLLEPSFHMEPVPWRSYVLSSFWLVVAAFLTLRFLSSAEKKGKP